AGVERVGDDGVAAILTSGTQVMEALEVSALALPVADRVVHELEFADVAEIGDREDRAEHRLQADVVTLAGELVHLQEAIVRTLLHFDQVRDLDGRRDLAEVDTVTEGTSVVRHKTP